MPRSVSPRDIFEAATIQLAPCRPHEKSNTNTLDMKQNGCCCVEMLSGPYRTHCSVLDVVGRLGEWEEERWEEEQREEADAAWEGGRYEE